MLVHTHMHAHDMASVARGQGKEQPSASQELRTEEKPGCCQVGLAQLSSCLGTSCFILIPVLAIVLAVSSAQNPPYPAWASPASGYGSCVLRKAFRLVF